MLYEKYVNMILLVTNLMHKNQCQEEYCLDIVVICKYWLLLV